MGELAQHGRDKLTYRGLGADLELRALGRAADRRVDREARQGHPARGRRAARARRSVYGDDRVFAYLRNEDEPDEELDAASRGARPGRPPDHHRPVGGAADLGRIFFFAEFATAVAGWALGINPFDQPNVQEAKDNTARILEEGLPDVDAGSLDELLAGAAPPHYIAISASSAFRRARRRRRRAARGAPRRTKCDDHFGYGPSYLHSTGQFHKGGPPNGLFIQLYKPAAEDIEIPEAGYTFEHLKSAQALGDMQTLRAHGLPGGQDRKRRPGGREEVDLMQLGFVGLGKMGGNMVTGSSATRSTSASRSTTTGGHRHGGGTRRERRVLARGAGLEARAAAHCLDHGPGRRSDAEHR